MLQSDWLDYGTWTIYTFRIDGPDHLYGFLNTGFLGRGRETIDRGGEKFVTFGKLSVNFRKLSGKT